MDVPPPEDTKSALQRLRERLYSPGATSTFSVPAIGEHAQTPGEPWHDATALTATKKKLPIAVIFFAIAAGFFLIALGATLYLVLFGGRTVSVNKIDIGVQGPTAIASGDGVPLVITITNRNPVAITATDIEVDFPEGTRSPDNLLTPLARYTDTLGDIEPGATQTRTVRAVLFGSQNQKITIPVTLHYNTQASNSAFVKEKDYVTTVTTSPLSVNVTSLTQVSSGQPLELQVLVRSNATVPLGGVAIYAEYPFGFIPDTATATSSLPGVLTPIGTLAPGEEKTLRVRGTLSGSENDLRVFRFTVGTTNGPNPAQLAVPYTSFENTVTLTKPFLATTLAINRDTSDAAIVDAGQPIQGVITWTNTLASELRNAQVAIHLAGAALNTGTVTTSNGYYRSSDVTVLFSGDTSGGLRRLLPNDSGSGSFNFATKSGSMLTGLRNPTITLTVSVAGQRTGDTNVPEAISATLTRTIKIGTALSLTSRAVHTTGPFTDTGPVPPESNKETLYTIILTAGNTVNTVSGATLTATLPSNVRYTGQQSPSDGTIMFDEASRTLTWNIGDLPAGSGSGGAPKQMAIQVALLPSVSERGTSPLLISTQSLTGTDRFTGRQVDAAADPLTTDITTDPSYRISWGPVKK